MLPSSRHEELSRGEEASANQRLATLASAPRLAYRRLRTLKNVEPMDSMATQNNLYVGTVVGASPRSVLPTYAVVVYLRRSM